MGDLTNIKNKLLVEQIEEQLLQYILETPINVDEKLPNEYKLGELFGVGRSTIREAVKTLVTKRILEIRRGAGTYVISHISPEDDPLGLRNAEDKLALAFDLVNVRMMLEPGIAEMAAMNATESDIRKLKDICELLEEKIQKGGSYIKEDILFHTTVAECSKNKVVEQLVPIIDTAVMMFVNVTNNKLANETVMAHRQVVEAIEAQDIIGARAAMMMHMTFNRNRIRELEKDRGQDRY